MRPVSDSERIGDDSRVNLGDNLSLQKDELLKCFGNKWLGRNWNRIKLLFSKGTWLNDKSAQQLLKGLEPDQLANINKVFQSSMEGTPGNTETDANEGVHAHVARTPPGNANKFIRILESFVEKPSSPQSSSSVSESDATAHEWKPGVVPSPAHEWIPGVVPQNSTTHETDSNWLSGIVLPTFGSGLSETNLRDLDAEKLVGRAEEILGKLTVVEQEIFAPKLDKIKFDLEILCIEGCEEYLILFIDVFEKGASETAGDAEKQRLARFLKMAEVSSFKQGHFFTTESSALVNNTRVENSPWSLFELSEERFQKEDGNAELFAAALSTGRFEIVAKLTLLENHWDELQEPQKELFNRISESLIAGKGVPAPLDNLLSYCVDHLKDPFLLPFLSFVIQAMDEDHQLVSHLLQENEIHLITDIFKTISGKLEDLNQHVPDGLSAPLAKRWIQLTLLKLNKETLAKLFRCISTETADENQAVQILDKWIAFFMHDSNNAEILLPKLLESLESSNGEAILSKLDDLLKEVLAPHFERSMKHEALMTSVGNHNGGAVFYHEMMSSIFPMLIAPGNTVNVTMAEFLESWLFGNESAASGTQNGEVKREDPVWLAEEKMRSLLRVVQTSPSFRSICNGIELNSDPRSPMHEAARLQLGMDPQQPVSIADMQLLTLMSVGDLLRQAKAGTCISTSSLIRLGFKNPEAVAACMSQFTRLGVLQPILVTDKGIAPYGENSRSLVSVPGVSPHFQSLSYSMILSGDRAGWVKSDFEAKPIWELPNIVAACHAMGIEGDAIAQAVREVLPRLSIQESKEEFKRVAVFDLLHELAVDRQIEGAENIPSFERAYTAFTACEENIAHRMMEAVTVQTRGQGSSAVEERAISYFLGKVSPSFKKLDRSSSAKFVAAFHAYVRLPFKLDAVRLNGQQVPYLLVSSGEEGVHFLPLDQGSSAWGILAEKVKELIIQDGSEAIIKAVKSELAGEFEIRTQKSPDSAVEHVFGDRWDSDFTAGYNTSGFGMVWATQEFINEGTSEIRFNGAEDFIEKFPGFITECRNRPSVQEGIRETPFFPVTLLRDGEYRGVMHQQSLLPGHPSLESLFPSEKSEKDSEKSVSEELQIQLIEPGEEKRDSYVESAERDSERQKEVLSWIITSSIAEHVELNAEKKQKLEAKFTDQFFEKIKCSPLDDVVHEFREIMSSAGLSEDEKEEFLLQFEWKMTQHYFSKGKLFAFADTNWIGPDGSPVFLSIGFNFVTGKPQLWIVSEEGRLLASATRKFSKGKFSTLK